MGTVGDVGDLPSEKEVEAHLRIEEFGLGLVPVSPVDGAAGDKVNEGEKGVWGLWPVDEESVELVDAEG